MRLQSSFNRN